MARKHTCFFVDLRHKLAENNTEEKKWR